MKQLYILVLGATVLGLAACSDSDNNQSSQPAATTPAPAQQTQQQPAGKPLSPAQQQAINDAKGMPKQGTVKEMMHSSGYTYMNVDIGNGKTVWIAATMMRVKTGDKVQWADAAVMRNFNSSGLHRTFDEILFVSSASVMQ